MAELCILGKVKRMDSLVPVLVCILTVFCFGALMLSVARLLGARGSHTRAKSLPYECGIEEEEPSHSRVPVQFYLTAILFILFDIEIIFLYPWALSFGDFLKEGRGLEVLLIMGVFILIFVFGLIWEIRSRALKWR